MSDFLDWLAGAIMTVFILSAIGMLIFVGIKFPPAGIMLLVFIVVGWAFHRVGE